MRQAAAVAIVLCGPLALGVERPAVIRIKPNVAYNVTRDDMARLRELASGVGWEFEPNARTTAGLKHIGIRRIRCINVDPLPGRFDKDGQFHVAKERNRLDAHLDTCRAVGASPHVIIATGMHPDLRVKAEDVKAKDERIMGLLKGKVFGPRDVGRFRNYCKAYFQYVLIRHKFPDACFEVANEPDIGGAVVPLPPRPERGSRGLYEAYWNLYSNVAVAAREFEAEHPGTKVTLGGPALAWAFTFRFGDFNWTERFVRDVQREKTKLDFIGLHFYGNISSLSGESRGAYPSFAGMMRMTRQWRDRYTPGVPIWFTEWGATYHTSLAPQSLHNGNHVGAAYAAAFLNQMLVEGVEKALYLVTTDLRQKIEGKWQSVWGWPSLFTNPHALGAHPKAPYHVFQMLSRMAPKRVEATRPGRGIGCIASRDDRRRVTVLVWNHRYRIDESGPGVETGLREMVGMRILDGFYKEPVRMQRWLVSRTVSNARHLFETGEKLDARAELQRVEEGILRPINGVVDVGVALPPSSVTLVELVPVETK